MCLKKLNNMENTSKLTNTQIASKEYANTRFNKIK